MSLKANFELMGRYNQWMNQQIYRAAMTLSEDKIKEDQGAFFRSILGTLNHILVGDTVWLQRFAQHPKRYNALAGMESQPKPASLDHILYAQIDNLWAVRQEFDSIIVDWTQEIMEDDLSVDLTYTTMQGKQYADNFGQLVQHFFNHQTHHRGQVSTLLNQNGVDVGVTDLLALMRASQT